LNLTHARQLVAIGGLQVTVGDGANDTYSTEQVDNAILYVGNDFVESCRGVTRTSGTASLNSTTFDVSLASIPGFHSTGVRRVTVVDSDGIERQIARIDVGEMTRRIAYQGTAVGTGTPTAIAFFPGSVAKVDVMPGSAATYIVVTHDPPFTPFTPGTATSGTTVLNIPDRYAYPVFHDGASAVMQLADPVARSQSEGWQRYLAHKARVMGVVGDDRGVIVADENQYL